MKDKILKWLEIIEVRDGTPPIEVIAFNFGLYETENGYRMYLVGGFEYSEENDDWACIELPIQEYRYLNFPPEMKSQPWESILAYSAKLLKELENEGKLSRSMFGNAVAITTGFDDGDLVKIR